MRAARSVTHALFYGCAPPATICAKQTEIFKRRSTHGKDHRNRPRHHELVHGRPRGRRADGRRERRGRPHHAVRRRVHPGRRAGYYELDPTPDATEIAYFGLLPEFQGHGLGGHLLTHALRRAFELSPRAWVHTCTLDGPHALANYQARGLRQFRTQLLGAA